MFKEGINTLPPGYPGWGSGRTEGDRQHLQAHCWHGDRGKEVFSISPAISFGDA